jgi:hypothetical protein
VSAFGIAEAMRWDADYRKSFPAAASAVVTDDLSISGTNEGIVPRIQYQTTQPLSPRYKMDKDMVPGQAVWWHEREHHMFSEVQARVGIQYGNALVKAAFSARGADPALVDADENLATEQMASMLPEAFGLGWGGYAHPCTNVPVPEQMRQFFYDMAKWTPPVPKEAPMAYADVSAQLARADWTFGQSQKTNITVHWNGTWVDPTRSDLSIIKADAAYHCSKDWSPAPGVQGGDGIMYHRVYGRDGTVYFTRDPLDVLWHSDSEVGNWTSEAWMVLVGEGQMATVPQLLAVARDLNADPRPRDPHSDYVATKCPGDELRALITNLPEDDLADAVTLAKLDELIAAMNRNTDKVGALAHSFMVWMDREQRGVDVASGGPDPDATKL